MWVYERDSKLSNGLENPYSGFFEVAKHCHILSEGTGRRPDKQPWSYNFTSNTVIWK